MTTRVISHSGLARPVQVRRALLTASPLILAWLASFAGGLVGEAAGLFGLLYGLSIASWMFLSKRRLFEGREAKAWLFLGLALASGAIGVTAVGIIGSFGPLPAFGPLDVFFLTAYMLNIVGLLSLPHLEGSARRRISTILDGLIGAVAVTALAWLWLAPIVAGMQVADPLQRALGAAYPILDVAGFIVLLVVTLRRSRMRFDPRVGVFGLAMLAQAGADLDYLINGVGRSFGDATPLYPLYVTAAGLYMGAGFLLDRIPPSKVFADRRVPVWMLVAPYGAAGVLAVLFLATLVRSGASARLTGLGLATLAVAALVVVRQTVAIRDNAESVDAQRRELISSVSHELRTPLTAMLGFLTLLQSGAIDDEGERSEMLGVVTDQAEFLSRVVSDLILLARGGRDLSVTARSVNVCGDIIAPALAALPGGADDVKVECSADVAVTADPVRLRQVVTNLITNARRYAQPPIAVVVESLQDEIVIEVHDSGDGVPKKHELAIWDRFERGAHRLDAGVPGSGIGLSIVKAVAEAHRGSASYRRSELLGGACFSVRVPR